MQGESCCFFECGEAADVRVRVRVRARLANLRRLEQCACEMQLIYSTCGSTKLWSPTEHFLVSVLVCECCDPSLCVSVWLLVKCMPCILITPQPQKSWAATAATIAILVNSVWKSGQWECGPRNRSTYQRTLWLKKIQREKKQHRHDITIGPEVTQRSWNTLNNTAAPRKHHGFFFFFYVYSQCFFCYHMIILDN